MSQSDLTCEDDRLVALDAYDILDTAPSPAFERVVRLVRTIFDVPMATDTFVDGHRQWFKARQGLRERQTCKGPAFCNVTIRQAEPLVVPDTLADARFKDNPFVRDAPHLRFYAGAQLTMPEGHNIGALCAMDTRARIFDQRDIAILDDLAGMVMSELEAQKAAATDTLTGALSRRGFRKEAEMALALPSATHTP